MVLVHVVLLRVRQDADVGFLRQLLADIDALATLPGVLSIEVGPASTALYEGYTDRTAGMCK